MSLLSEKAMLVSLRISGWTATAHDKAVSEEVAQQAGAIPDAGRYTKRLLPKHATQPLTAIASRMREVHEDLTMPWSKGAQRLLPTTEHANYVAQMNALIEERNAAGQDFLKNYQRYIAEAAKDLGQLYNPEDYPDEQKLASLITADYNFDPVPEAEHFIADLAQTEIDRVKADIAKRNDAKLRLAIDALYQRLQEAVALCNDRLTEDPEGKPRIFRDTMLTNLSHIAETIPRLNITENADLDRYCQQVRHALQDVKPDQLRPNHRDYDPEKREQVKAAMSEIAAQMPDGPF